MGGLVKSDIVKAYYVVIAYVRCVYMHVVLENLLICASVYVSVCTVMHCHV